MLLCILKHWKRDRWTSLCLVTAGLRTHGNGLAFDTSCCMLVYLKGGFIQALHVSVDVLYRKCRFGSAKTTSATITKFQLSKMSGFVNGMYQHLFTTLCGESSPMSPSFVRMIKNCRDSLNHAYDTAPKYSYDTGKFEPTCNVWTTRRYSHCLQLLCFLRYCVSDELWSKMAKELHIIDVFALRRREYLAVPDWIWRATFEDYSSLENGLQIVHDNTVQFYKWIQGDVDTVAEQLTICYSNAPLVRSFYKPTNLIVREDVISLMKSGRLGQPKKKF